MDPTLLVMMPSVVEMSSIQTGTLQIGSSLAEEISPAMQDEEEPFHTASGEEERVLFGIAEEISPIEMEAMRHEEEPLDIVELDGEELDRVLYAIAEEISPIEIEEVRDEEEPLHTDSDEAEEMVYVITPHDLRARRVFQEVMEHPYLTHGRATMRSRRSFFRIWWFCILYVLALHFIGASWAKIEESHAETHGIEVGYLVATWFVHYIALYHVLFEARAGLVPRRQRIYERVEDEPDPEDDAEIELSTRNNNEIV